MINILLCYNYVHVYIYVPGGSHNIEADALKVYKENSEGTFSVGDLFYAKAVCCLRCISIIKVSVLLLAQLHS